jgi:DEAD_2
MESVSDCVIQNYVQAHPKDIEDLVSLGREQKTCPYYGTRKAINRAEVLSISTLRCRLFLIDLSACDTTVQFTSPKACEGSTWNRFKESYCYYR